MRFVESGSEWAISFEGAVVSSIGIDFRITFTIFDEAESVDVIIESAFSLSNGGGQALVIHPEAAEKLSPILRLFNCEVVTVTADKSGTLRMTFADGTSLKVDPDELYEAWQIGLPKNKLICGPGGRVDHFRD